MQNKHKRGKCFTNRGGDRKKCNDTVNVFNKDEQVRKKRGLSLHCMLWNGSGKPIQHVISFWLWGKAFKTNILAEPEEGCQRR